MRTKYAILIVPLGLLCLAATAISEDIISRLGLKHADSQNYLLANITGSFSSDFEIRQTEFFFPRIKTLADIISGDEVGAARELCQYVRDYVNSQEFLDAYQQKRTNSKPTYEPEPVNPEMLENMRTSIKELEGQVAEMKKSPGENAQMIAMFEPMIASQKATLAEYEDPTPNRTKWERNYPADPAVLVKRKLNEYLELVATVDFNAQLTAPDQYKIRKFVNPDYESRSNHWKACYRAGKEVNAAVTIFVKDWLAGEIIAANKTSLVRDTQPNPDSAIQDPAVAVPSGEQVLDPTAEDSGEQPKQKTSLLGKLKKAKSLIKD